MLSHVQKYITIKFPYSQIRLLFDKGGLKVQYLKQ